LSNEFEDKVQFDGRIYLLKTLASFINPSENSEIPVTLNAHGTVVSGIMIGMKPYYEYFGKSMIDNLKDLTQDDPTVSKKALKVLFDNIQEQAILEQQSVKDLQFNHIFLRNEKIYNGAQVITASGTMYWVGKLESVDGFFLDMIHLLET
jgi:hypothetical protein